LNCPGGHGCPQVSVVPVPCGSGLKLDVLPWVVVVVVCWNFGCFSFFPEVVVVHTTWPLSFVQFEGRSCAAKTTVDGTRSAVATIATTINKPMRLITLYILSLHLLPN
jgi:hypothetical protein